MSPLPRTRIPQQASGRRSDRVASLVLSIGLSTTITGDAMCRATDKTYRLDTPAARAFLDNYGTLP